MHDRLAEAGTWALDAETISAIRASPGERPSGGLRQLERRQGLCCLVELEIRRWLSLLAEAEWEYLARADSRTAYPWGPGIDGGCTHMNGFDQVILEKKGNLYRGEAVPFAACSDGYLNTSPVGAFVPNAFGVYDMIGNLAEWVEDCATPSYAALQSDGRHADGDCGKRMVRGGSSGHSAAPAQDCGALATSRPTSMTLSAFASPRTSATSSCRRSLLVRNAHSSAARIASSLRSAPTECPPSRYS